MSTLRDALWVGDSRLTSAAAFVVVFLAIDFFTRVVLFSPVSSQPAIEEVVTLSDAIPQIGQTQLDSYLANIAGMIELPAQAGTTQLSVDLVAQQPATSPTDRLWRTELFSYKLIALVEDTERFAVLYSIDNESGVRGVLEIRHGDSIAGYTVSDLLSKEVSLTGNKGDQVTLSLFEPEE